jgi:uncharacterized repeat protein (TIGR01451 family)
MFKHKVVFTSLILALIVVGLFAAPVHADGGDFSLDLTAAAPYTYDHSTGGGAFNDRTVGVNSDIVESLEGGDFRCGDIVTYLTQILVDAGATGAQTIEIDYEFLGNSTGQAGVGMIDIVDAKINYGPVQNGAGPGGVDSGISDDGNSVASLISESIAPPAFTSGSVLAGTVKITDLEAGEKVVLRIDVLLDCDPDSNPTGNLQASVKAARVVSPTLDTISAGAQTIPFLQVGNVIDAGEPALEVVKTVMAAGGTCGVDDGDSLTVNKNDQVVYCYTVTNVGTATAFDVVLTDDSGTPGISGDDFTVTLSPLVDGTDLASGASASGQSSAITMSIAGTIVNTATAVGYADETGRDLPNAPNPTDDDTASVDVVFADITLDKSVYSGHSSGAGCPGNSDLLVERGTNVTYCFIVTNTGETDLAPVFINDPVIGIDQDDMTLLSGTVPLEPGESLVYYYETTIDEPIRNIAVASVTPIDDDGTVIDISDSISFTDTVDIDLRPKAAIGDYVWEDLNVDGIQDEGEPGMADVTVRLFRANGQLVAETQTDDDGFYSFTNLDAGDYYVVFVLPDFTLFAFTVPNAGDDPETDSNANETAGRTPTISLGDGETDNSIDAGIFARCGLRLDKTPNVGSVAPGDTLLYVLTYSNVGARDATAARIMETVPQATTFVPERSSPGWGCEDGGQAGAECNYELGNIPADDQGGLEPIIFAVELDLDLTGVSGITNRAVIYDQDTVCSSTGEGTADDGIGGNDDEVTVPTGPTVVVLERFTAVPLGDTIIVSWTTSAEIDTRGFYLYRSVTGNRDAAARVTPTIILGKGPNGGNYTFTDKYVFEDVTFTYWLVEEELSGRLLEYGPVSTSLGASVNQQRIFLPMVTK